MAEGTKVWINNISVVLYDSLFTDPVFLKCLLLCISIDCYHHTIGALGQSIGL